MAEIIIGAGHELVPVMEVPKLIALARHGLPARYPLEEPEEEDGPLTYDLSIWNDVLRIEDERGHRKDLFSAASRGEVRLVTSPGHRPTTWGHHAHLTIDALTLYVAQFGVEVKVAPDKEPAEAVSVVVTGDRRGTDEAAPLPLTTGDVAFCFAGLRWKTEQQWKKPLGDKPLWLKACVAIPGRRGGPETRWDPVRIGAALVHAGHASPKSVRARFQTQPSLKPWLEAWKTYEADHIDTE